MSATHGSAPGTPRVTGIVLAGGRSSRFGTDKLAAGLDGVPLLDRAIGAIAAACDETLVVVPPGGRAGLPAGAIAVPDPEPFGGPLVGLLAGLERATGQVALVVAGDMPWLEPAVLRRLVAELAADPAPACALESATDAGRPERLPLALRTVAARTAAGALLGAGDRRLRSLPAALGTRLLPAATWLALDPAARTPRDVDLPADLPDRADAT